MEQQGMHEDDVAGRRRVLQHLQRDAVEFLYAFVKPRDAGGGVAGRAQVPHVRMKVDRRPQLGAASARFRGILLEPPMEQPMRAAEDWHSTRSGCDLAEHGVDL